MAVYLTQIEDKHIDSFGHLNNAAYLELYEDARWDLITRNGYGPEVVQKTRLAPVILEVTVKFKRELKGGQPISIETRLNENGRVVSIIHQTIRNEAGEVCSEAFFKSALMNLDRRKLVSATPEWKHALEMSNR